MKRLKYSYGILPERQTGFSLVELMVAMAISVFLIGGMLLMHSSGRSASVEGERLSRMQENIRFTSDYLVREMRNAGFRDQLSLTINQFNQIGQEFARINNDGSITLWFSGTGSCAEGFTGGLVGQIVQNTYFVDADSGELRCTGIVGGNPLTVALANGVQSATFELICPDGTNSCPCELWVYGDGFEEEREKLNASCQGVNIELVFDGPAGADPVTVEMRAAFRNIILGRMMWNSIPAL